MPRRYLFGAAAALVAVAVVFAIALAMTRSPDSDDPLRATVNRLGLKALDAGPEHSQAMVDLGQALFFDAELSGNRDISCATCHHPAVASGDALSVSIGTGGTGLAAERVRGAGRDLIPRNAPEVFNRGSEQWHTMFWDSRVRSDGKRFDTPADEDLPDGLDSVLAAQAMFPVTSGDEMKGDAGDMMGLYDSPNELARLESEPAVWRALMERLLAIDGYVTLFEAAYPDATLDELGFQHAANAIAAFEATGFAFADTPWDRYLEGDEVALSDDARAGALLFYGDAGCAACHSGDLFTDQEHHNIGAPQVGPGKGVEAPRDLGRARETGSLADIYSFRTPPLRNVALTGPWFHDGAYVDLTDVIRHHLDPIAALAGYDPAQLDAELAATYDPAVTASVGAGIDPLLAPQRLLTETEVGHLLAFLDALTDPAARDLSHLVPDTVPSGLPIDRPTS